MAERTWNMLKLVPSISASRKNSMITGLARIDEHTDELVLSLYHLPDPKEFLDVKSGTYFAWFYDGHNRKWKKIGKLQQKNGLTFSLKKKTMSNGDGIFVTAEAKGQEPNVPGEVIVSSNTEIFYQDLKEESSVDVPKEIEPVVREAEVIDHKGEPEILVEQAEQFKEQVAEHKEQSTLEKPVILETKVEEKIETEVETEIKAESERTDLSVEEIDSELDNVNLSGIDSEKFMNDQEFINRKSDLPIDDFMGIMKERFEQSNEDMDFKEYWNKCKEYLFDLYEDLKLQEFYEEIKDDIKDLFERFDLDKFWNHLKEMVLNLVETIQIHEWIGKAKCMIQELDIEEWYCKVKGYIEAVLEEIDLNKFWNNMKHWMGELLENMDVDQIMHWIKCKFSIMQNMSGDELKTELKNLALQAADRLQMPELKLAVFKVALKEKASRLGDFFHQVKEKIEIQKEDFKKEETQNVETKNTPKRTQSKHPEERYSVNFTQSPYPYTPRSYTPESPEMTNHRTNNSCKEMYHNMGAEMYANHYDNPYTCKAMPNYSEQHDNLNPMPYGYYPYASYYSELPMEFMNNNCQWMYPYCCQGCFQVGYDALGVPRYFYDGEDGEHYFITPDGEIIRKS